MNLSIERSATKLSLLVATLFVIFTHTLLAQPVLLLDEAGHAVWSPRSDAASEALADAPVSDLAITQRLIHFATRQVEGPNGSENQAGLSGLFPLGTTVDDVIVEDGHAVICLTVPADFVDGGIDEEIFEAIVRMQNQWAEMTPGLQSLGIKLRPEGTSEYQPLSAYEIILPALNKPEPAASAAETPQFGRLLNGASPAVGQPQPSGSLSGASIFVNPSHGWYYSSALDRWATQRGNTNNIIEDLNSGESWNQFLMQYLWNAGARTYWARERDLQTNMVIVDNGGTGHSETGSWSTQSPGATYGADQRAASTMTGTETATSTFTPNIPESGNYAVYVWYRSSSSGTTTTDAAITVNHSGGSTTWTQNQTRDGQTWKYIGTFHFDAGSNPGFGSVVVSNLSGTAGNMVVADAVRFGGGMGDMIDPGDAQNRTSGEPRWEESGLYYAGFLGKTDWASQGTVTAMPRWAAWENESWETDSCYISIHTNAFDGSARGTVTYAYSSAGTGGAFNGVAGGDVLRNMIQAEMINDIHAGWDAGWQDRGTNTANFGEVNPNNNSEMPAALMEVAFHDNAIDADALEDPRFRHLIARAIYQGTVKFYNSFYGYPSTLLPEPPENFSAVNVGDGDVALTWVAPPFNTGDDLLGDAATGYRVYQSIDGRGFDNGVAVAGTSHTVTGLTPGQIYYFRIAATNTGGESFPTETLAVQVRDTGAAPLLVVNGFDRFDKSLNVVEDDPYDADPLHRGFLWLMNTRDYVIAHAEAIGLAGVDFDSCANEAVISGQVALGAYDTVVWILGEESTADSTFDATEQGLVSAFIGGGGKIFVSGAEIGWDLEAQGNGAAFYNSTLRSDYVGDDAGTYAATGVTGTIFDGISLSFDDGSSIYDVEFPDTLQGINGSVVAMTYDVGGNPGAALQYPSGTGTNGEVVMLGFPFESILDEVTRAQVMSNALTFLDVSAGGGDTTPPAAPTGLAATAGNAEVSLDWNDNGEPDLAGYNVHRSTSTGGPYTKINGVTVASSAYTDSTVTNDTTYYYVVTAIDSSANESGNSNEDSATPTGPPFTSQVLDDDNGAPEYTETGSWSTSGSTGYNGGTYRFATASAAHTATWTIDLPVAGDYEISVQYREGTNRTTSTQYDLTTASGTQSSFIDQTINGFTWVTLGTFTMNAGTNSTTLDALGSTGGSVVIADAVRYTLVSQGDPPPAAPTGLGATAGDGQVDLNWNDNGEGDLDGYNVYRSTTSGSGYTQINGSLVLTSDYSDTTVTNDTTYYYVVTAVDTGANESADSNEASATPTAGLDPAEMRLASIVVFDDINDTVAIQNWVDEIASLNYNSVAIHTRYRGDATYFPNKTDSTYPNVEPRSSAAGSIDVLEEFVTRGHAAGLDVYAYVNTHLVTDGADSHPDPNHVVNVHPDWRTYEYNGGTPVIQTSAHDSGGLWLDAGHPEVTRYLANICGDIMMNYDCDGIILDRIRYPQSNFSRTTDFGFNPVAVARFNAQFGKSGTPTPSDPDWILFRQQQITGAVQAIHSVITAIDPDHVLLAYPIGRFNDAINYNYQDWPTWLSDGSIDGVLPQIYTSDNPTFSSRCDTHIAAYGGPRLLGVTTQAYVSGIDIAGQIQIVRDKGMDGTSPFRHGSMGALGYFTDLQQKWINPAPWPDMPWSGTDTVAPSTPLNIVTSPGDGQVDLDWDDNIELDLAGYNVSRSTTPGGPYTQVNGSLIVGSAYSDTTVTNNTTYYYVVSAVDTNSHESNNSDEVSETPTGGPDVTPPAAPANLVATAGDGQVDLDWDDNTEPDLDGYNVYRSTTSGSGYAQINGALLTVSDFIDTTVTNDTTYYYVIVAFDTTGNFSPDSNEEEATPTAAGGDTTNLTTADFSTTQGSITAGSHTDTHTQNNVREQLTEQHQGGKPANRVSQLIHTWTFNVAAGSSYTFAVEAYHDANSEGDDFVFSYSTDNSSYTPMLTVTKTADNDTLQMYVFPEDVSGTLYVRVEDTDRTVGNGNLESIYVDEMYVLSTDGGGGDITPPAAPTGLVATAGNGQVDLDWNDSGEGDLNGYNVYRSTTSGSGYAQINGGLVGPSAYTDSTVSNGTTYYYVVTALDTSANESGNSNEDAATPTGGGSATDTHVDAIVVDTVNAGQGNKYGRATVTVRDNTGALVQNATVTGTFTGSYSETLQGVTNASGVATIQTSTTQKGGVTFTFCVDNITHATLGYDSGANNQTCASF